MAVQSMNLDAVLDHFEEEAEEYDSRISHFIPHYRVQNSVLLDLIPFSRQRTFRMLDLGAGTGVLTHLVLEMFPASKAVVNDFSENMLATAKERLQRFSGRFEILHGDFSQMELPVGIDLILAGFSIHHLDDRAKQDLFGRVFRSLNANGIFLIRDIVLGSNKSISEHYIRIWQKHIRSSGENVETVMGNYLREDIPARVEDQLSWLQEAGFENAACHWRYMNFAIFGGQKPT